MYITQQCHLHDSAMGISVTASWVFRLQRHGYLGLTSLIFRLQRHGYLGYSAMGI